MEGTKCVAEAAIRPAEDLYVTMDWAKHFISKAALPFALPQVTAWPSPTSQELGLGIGVAIRNVAGVS